MKKKAKAKPVQPIQRAQGYGGYEKYFSALSENQTKIFFGIMERLRLKKNIRIEDVGNLGFDTAKATHKETWGFFKTTRDNVYKWVEKGCPRNQDGTYNLFEVHRWLLNREIAKSETTSKSDLEAKKMIKDIELKDLIIQKRKGELISMDRHQMILGARISALHAFLTGAFKSNLHYFEGKTRDELNVIVLEFVKQLMGAYINGSRSIDF